MSFRGFLRGIVSSMADPSQPAVRASMERLTQVLRQEAYAMPPVKGRDTKTIYYLSAFEKAIHIIINYISVVYWMQFKVLPELNKALVIEGHFSEVVS